MRLPPLNALRAFEAAARHNGFVAASDELHVTRGAIGRHVKLLEEHLGVQLFDRRHNGVELTTTGQKLLSVLTEAFEKIAREAEAISRTQSDLRIICTPALSIRWLFPKLEEFRTMHPKIGVRLTTDFFGEKGLDTSEYDLGFSVENWPDRSPDIKSAPLFQMRISPACAPSLLKNGARLTVPEDLASFTLLHETRRREDWATWISSFGVDVLDPASGVAFPNLDMAVKAAVMGAGVVMADLTLCGEEINLGTLVLPFEDMTCETPEGSYCLIASRDKWQDEKVLAFKDWAQRTARLKGHGYP